MFSSYCSKNSSKVILVLSNIFFSKNVMYHLNTNRHFKCYSYLKQKHPKRSVLIVQISVDVCDTYHIAEGSRQLTVYF